MSETTKEEIKKEENPAELENKAEEKVYSEKAFKELVSQRDTLKKKSIWITSSVWPIKSETW